MKTLTVIIISILAFSNSIIAGPKPTHKNIKYSDTHKRNKLDVWIPKSKTPTPLIVYFHGGSFKHGDKSHFYNRSILSINLGKGVAFASVNYPFIKDIGILEILANTTASIKFLKSKSKEWNIDPNKIAVMGTSAGAIIAEYLTYWAKDLKITGCYGEQQPYRSWFLLTAFAKNDPPLILYTRSGLKDKVHHPKHAKTFKTHCDNIGIQCELYGSKTSGLPQLPTGINIEKKVMQFFTKQWNQPKAITKKKTKD